MFILTVCGMGFGTSLMMLMEIQDMAKRNGFEVEGEATDLSSSKGKACDLIVAGSEIASEISSETTVIPIYNLLDKQEFENKVLPKIREYFDAL